MKGGEACIYKTLAMKRHVHNTPKAAIIEKEVTSPTRKRICDRKNKMGTMIGGHLMGYTLCSQSWGQALGTPLCQIPGHHGLP